MRIYAFLFAVVASFALLANDFVPVHNGNVWNYETDYDQSTMPTNIQGYDGNWVLFDCFFGLENQWVWTRDNDSRIFLWNGTTYELLFDDEDTIGTRYQITAVPGADYAEIGERGMTNTVAGEFDTITLELRSDQGRGPVIRSVTFARGLGVLNWTYLDPADRPATWSLTDATVAGQGLTFTTAPQPTAPLHACSVKAAYDKNFAYTPICPMGQPTCTVDPVDVLVEMTIENTGQEDIVYTFNNGQYFDIEIVDDQGRVCRRWSEGRHFTEAIWEHRIQPGETWTFGDRIEFCSTDGAHFTGGDYTVRITMKSLVVTAPFTLQQIMN